MLEQVSSRLSGSDGSINFVMLARNKADDIIAFHWVQAKPGEDKPHAHVVGLWVQSEYRKQGMATRLKLLGEAWCLEQGITELRTNVYTVVRLWLSLTGAEALKWLCSVWSKSWINPVRPGATACQ